MNTSSGSKKDASSASTTPSGEPSKWTVKQLLAYCSVHNIQVESGLEKKQLVELVDEHLTDAILLAERKDALQPNTERLRDLSGHSGEALLGYEPYDEYGVWLFADNTEALRSVVQAGIAQLNDTQAFADRVTAKQVPPLVSWMTVCLNQKDGGKSAAAAVTPATARSAVCGRYLQSQEMVARCEDCSADGTCVFCMDCFEHSPCRHHRIRITQSGGGGMCDCGDPSAWKPESFCSRHCGHRADDDPVAALGEKEKTWAVWVLRGAVQAICLVLKQSLYWHKAHSTAAPTRELVRLLEDWLGGLITALHALSQAGEVSRRLLSERWIEAVGEASGLRPDADGFTTCPCLDTVFQFELTLVDAHEYLKKGKTAWWLTLVQTVGMGLSDPFFRSHFIGMMGKYAERLSKNDALDDYGVQVFTNAEAVHYALTPAHLPYHAAADTIVHRSISGCLYYLTAVIGDSERFDKAFKASQTCDDVAPGAAGRVPLTELVLDENEEGVNLACFSKLRQAVGLSQEASALAILNRRAMCGIQVFLHIIDMSSTVFKNGSAPHSRYTRTATFAGRYMAVMLKFVQNSVRKLLRAYDDVTLHVGAGASAPGDDVDQRCLCVMGVAADVASEVFRDGVYDSPPDPVAARSTAHATALAYASDAENAAGHPFCRKDLSLALSDQEWDDRAFRCLMTQLYRVRALLVSYLTAQQNTFRHGNAAIVLEARPLSTQGLAGSAAAEHHLYEYSLLEPSSHAVGTTNLLSREFMMLVHVWVMHAQRRGRAAAQASHKSPSAADVLRRRLGASQSDEAPATAATAVSGDLHPSASPASVVPLSDSLHCAQPITRLAKLLIAHEKLPAARAMLQSAWLDAVVMPTVLLAQVEGGLWRRDEYNVNDTMSQYRGNLTKAHMEYDLYAVQMLATLMPANDLAVHVLERFSYDRDRKASKPKPDPSAKATATSNALKSRYPRGNRPGYARFLRLLLTVVLDSGKSSGQTDMSQDTITRMVAQVLSLSRCTHSVLAKAVEHSMQSGLDEDEDFDETNIKTAIRLALKEIAIEEEGQSGRVFRLKDTATWRRLVSPYAPQSMDAEREAMFNQYRTTVRLEELAVASAKGVTADDASSAAVTSKTVHVPPPSLPSQQAAELVSPLRALLHTDALLLSSLAVILAYAKKLRTKNITTTTSGSTPASTASPPATDPRTRRTSVNMTVETASSSSEDDASGSETSSEDWETSSEEEDDEEPTTHGAAGAPKIKPVRAVFQSTVQHAVTALYLCACDTAELSRALCYQHNGLFAADGGHNGSTGSDGAAVPPLDSPVDWERVESYLRDTTTTTSYTDDTLARVLPLSALRQSGSLRQLLARTVPSSRSSAVRPTVADVLHELWRHMRENAQEDTFSVARMLRYVLSLTGLAKEEVLKDDEEGEKANAQNLEALARKKQQQERQFKILQRMRNRATAAIANQTDDADTTADANPQNADLTPTNSVFLLARLLFRLSTLDCCVCRLSTAEPLLFLANCSTSGVLHHLDAMPLPDGRTVHSHVNICGHVAHAQCIRKYFTKLAASWMRGTFLGQRFLGPSEFSCPICLMVSQVQIPVPTITTSTASPTAPRSSTSTALNEEDVSNTTNTLKTAPKPELLFVELRRNSLLDTGLEEAATSTCTAVANAAIGFCDGSDNPALVLNEDDLQRHSSDAWILSETIRTIGSQIHLLVEGAKMGRDVNEHDLLALLSLMISLTPTGLAKHAEKLRTNFHRCNEPYSQLILDALLAPATTRESIATAAVELLRAPEAAKAASLVLSWATMTATAVAPSSSGPSDDASADPIARALAQPEVQQTCLMLWTEFACLTLLKVLLVEEPADPVVGVVGPPTSNASELCLLPFSSEALATAEGRRAGFLRMWQFLSPIALRHLVHPLDQVAAQLKASLESAPATDEEDAEAGAEADELPLRFCASPPPAHTVASEANEEAATGRLTVYENPAQWGAHILESVLHLPKDYVTLLTLFAQQKVCSQCGSNEEMSVQCRYCAQRLCLKPSAPRAPELYNHAVHCGCGVGIFLRVGATTLLITDAVSGRCVEPRSLYVDEFEETDAQMVRGTPLHLSASEATKFLHTWVMNRWGVESSILKKTWRGNLSSL